MLHFDWSEFFIYWTVFMAKLCDSYVKQEKMAAWKFFNSIRTFASSLYPWLL